jgi:hypothetical protein
LHNLKLERGEFALRHICLLSLFVILLRVNAAFNSFI